MYDHPMVPDAHTFRLATEKDLRSLAIMHVQAWREAYRDLMPNAVLAALDPTKRETTWRQVLHQGTRVTLALLEASVVGFMGAASDVTQHCQPMARSMVYMSWNERNVRVSGESFS